MTLKIAFFDIDGTLYQTTDNNIPTSSQNAIQELRNHGFIVCAATGRPLNQMNLILEQVHFDYMVMINGGYVVDAKKQILFETPISQENMKDIVKWCDEKQHGLMFHFGDASYIYNNFYPFYNFCSEHYVLERLFYDEKQAYHTTHPAYNAVIIMQDTQNIDSFLNTHKTLRSDLIHKNKNHHYYDLFPVTNDKYVGIAHILQREQLTWDNCICFGDNTNDIKMLEMAAVGVAMGNASDYVKSFANMVTTSVFEDGISNAVKKILSNTI